MRVVFSIFLFFNFQSLFSQTKPDTLDLLEKKARIYLEQTYSKQNFDSGSAQWLEFVIEGVQEIYEDKGIVLLEKADILKKLKEDYFSYYSRSKNFTFIKFEDKGMSDESKVPTAFFKYSYSEEVNGRNSTGISYLYFLFDTRFSEWKIWDYRISAILGAPNKWLK